jgi:hypothetical protein
MSGWHHDGCFKTKPCVVCGVEFRPSSGIHKFCSAKCKGKWPYITGLWSSENQYKNISGNWRKFFNRLRHRSYRKDVVSVDELLNLLKKQNGLCALSGVPMTCELVLGKRSHTNASIDRIIPGGAYSIDNVQLVCSVLNRFRMDTQLEDYIEWCRRVATYHDQKTN